MDFISVRELRSESAEVWRRLRKVNELVVTSNGKPIAIITPTSASTLESSVHDLRQAQALAALAQAQKASREHGASDMGAADIDAEIKVARKARRR